jgi:hypothetical protein
MTTLQGMLFEAILPWTPSLLVLASSCGTCEGHPAKNSIS